MHLDYDSSLAAWFGKLTGYKGDVDPVQQLGLQL